MKKLVYLILSLFLFQFTAFSQTAIIDEDFSFPVNWEMEGNWTQEDGYLMLYYYPIVEDYDFSTYTPEFEIPENGGDVSFSMFIDVYLANATDEQCEISIIYGNNEDVLWSYNLTDGPWGEFSGSELTLSLDDYVGETAKLRMRSYGASTSALWGWFVFSVNISTWFDHELSATEILGPTNINMLQNGTWSVDVKNQGLNTESNFQVTLYSYKSLQSLTSVTFNSELNPGETTTIDVTWSSDSSQNTVVYAKVESPDDQFVNNNKTNGSFLRIEPDMDYSILFWNNDNGIASVIQPETGILEEPHTGLMKAFQVAGINVTSQNTLPDNLEEYDIVIATMGCYCLS